MLVQPSLFLTVTLPLACTSQARAEIKLPAFFSDYMVLQTEQTIPIWGTAAPNSALAITLDTTSIKTTADATGKWRVELPARPAKNTPMSLQITGDGSVTIQDIFIGEVWLCSGQSNMGWKLAAANGGAKAIAASEDPLLRNFNVKAAGSPTPQMDVEGDWKAASPQTSGSFSAVAYFFARELRKELRIPVGIIHASVGDTPIEAWTRRATLDNLPSMAATLKASDATIAATPEVGNVLRKSTPSWLFNGFINPLVGYGIRGFVWYQGESNTDNAWQYQELFPAMLQDWQYIWKDPNRLFLFVQIAARDTTQDESIHSSTAELRESQSFATKYPNTAMVVNIDTRARDWHPLDKETPGRRLAYSALALTYNKQQFPHRYPTYSGKTREGNIIRIRFKNAQGLKTTGDTVTGFTIADASRKFVPAQANIAGETVEVQASGIQEPIAVRYGWSRGPYCNLVNSEGLPVAPFRTNDWPGVTGPK